MAIGIIEKQEVWDHFIDESPYGLLFHKWDFLKIIERHSGHRLLTYGIYKNQNLICLFPLFFKKVMGLKTIFSPPPQSGVPNLGFVMSKEFCTLKQDKKENVLNIVASEIQNEINQISPGYIFMALAPNFLDTRAFKWKGYDVDVSYTYVIELDKSLDDIWNSFTNNLRRAIRKTEKLNLRLTKSKDITTLYCQLQERYKLQNKNLTIFSKCYLEDLMAAYPDNIGLYYITGENGEIVAGTLTHEYKRFMTWIGTPKITSEIYGNEYLTWKLIEKAKANGIRKFELEGADSQKLCQFKTKFNPTLELTFHISQKNALGKLAEWTYVNLVKNKVI